MSIVKTMRTIAGGRKVFRVPPTLMRDCPECGRVEHFIDLEIDGSKPADA